MIRLASVARAQRARSKARQDDGPADLQGRGATPAARKFFWNQFKPLSHPRLLAHNVSDASPLPRSSVQVIHANKIIVYI